MLRLVRRHEYVRAPSSGLFVALQSIVAVRVTGYRIRSSGGSVKELAVPQRGAVLGCTDTYRYNSFHAVLVTDGPFLLQPVAALGDLVDPEDLQHLCQRR